MHLQCSQQQCKAWQSKWWGYRTPPQTLVPIVVVPSTDGVVPDTLQVKVWNIFSGCNLKLSHPLKIRRTRFSYTKPKKKKKLNVETDFFFFGVQKKWREMKFLGEIKLFPEISWRKVLWEKMPNLEYIASNGSRSAADKMLLQPQNVSLIFFIIVLNLWTTKYRHQGNTRQISQFHISKGSLRTRVIW